jgi:predicted transcriptional regulator
MSNESRKRGTKVARLIEKYELSGRGAELEAAWIGDDGERTSLRDLADEFNETILRSVLKENGISLSSFEVAGTYEALRHGSGSDETRARRRLEREGVDVAELTGDFVTHQSVHTYLTDERNASLPDQGEDAVERRTETIEKLEGRTAVVTEASIESTLPDEELNRVDYDVIVDVQVVCSACGSTYDAGELLRQGGCDCGDST